MDSKEFRAKVESKIPRSDVCPICAGALILLNSHKCQEGYDLWWDNRGGIEVEQLVDTCVQHIVEALERRNALGDIFK